MAEVTFSRYNTQDYLRTDEDIQAYLEAAFEEGDDSMVAVALSNVDCTLTKYHPAGIGYRYES